MQRAWNVLMGAILIFLLWTWMFSFPNNFQGVFWWITLFSRIICACYITAPLYREYLK